MLTSITRIKNLAVFKDFTWDASVRKPDGTPLQLKKVNIIYGRNYSGKTTLSRLVRSFETENISEKYGSPEYEVSLSDGGTISHASPANHSLEFRVFNEDYVKEHLAVFHNEEDSIAAFAVLGEDNAEVTEELARQEDVLGSDEVPGSLRGQEKKFRDEYSAAKARHDEAKTSFDASLTAKARTIKIKPKYESVNYNITRIRQDIESVTKNDYIRPSDEQLAAYENVLSETPKATIGVSESPQLKWQAIVTEAEKLLGRTIRPTEPLQELLNNATLQEWVRQGKELHKDVRTTCGFCGNKLPDDLWEKLDGHFSKASETLRNDLEGLVATIDREISASASLLAVDTTLFYGSFGNALRELEGKNSDVSSRYITSLQAIRKATQQRLKAIFSPVALPAAEDLQSDVSALFKEYETLRVKANDYTESLSTKQKESRDALRLSEVSNYLDDSGYTKTLEELQALKDEQESKAEQLKVASKAISVAVNRINELKGQLRDERNGAEKVNQYLNHDFGHRSLRLEAVPAEDGTDAQYYFTIKRDGHDAYHLSEGERSLLAFCYFLARLDDAETSGKPLIVWIDDPVSNMDDNHAFFVYSLIRTQIAQHSQCSQLFVSTHNLSFLKYLHRLDTNRKRKCHLLIERNGDASRLVAMPGYLKQYVTEFHHLFRQIYECATADLTNTDNEGLFYSFPNNLRRFLEMFLVFKYPDHSESNADKIDRFFGCDTVAATMADRVNNEYSHVHGLFERVSLPMDPPLMKSIAICVLDRLKADQEQYKSLLRSIGVDEATIETDVQDDKSA